MNHEPIIFMNGTFVNTEETSVNFPIEERGFQFGDGVYEVIRIYKGNYYTLDEHLTRLYRSLNEVKIELAWEKEELTKILDDLKFMNNFSDDGIIYLQVSRGSAARNHLFPTNTTPNIVAYVKKAVRPVESLETGISVYLSDDIRWLRCDIKSLNLLPNVLAKQTAFENGCFEALFHRDGVVTECSASNVYMVKDGAVYTHPTTNLILNGITRQRVKTICESNQIPFIERAFHILDLASADEMFLTSTTSEVMPIVSVSGNNIANGEIGVLTKKLQNLFSLDTSKSEQYIKKH